MRDYKPKHISRSSTEKAPPMRLRPAVQEDVDFIFNSWLKSYRISQNTRNIPNTIFYTEQHKLIEKLIKTSQIIVACAEDDASQIYGWICATYIDKIFCLHFMYVKHTFRLMGIARQLLNCFEYSGTGIYTHFMPSMIDMSSKFGLIYDPYILLNDYIKVMESSDENEAKN